MAHKEKRFREGKTTPDEFSDLAFSDKAKEKENIKLEKEKNDAEKEAMKNKEKAEKAEEESLVDGLTGLRNRKSLNLDGIQILGGEKRDGHNCSIIMFDLDHFKNVNDTYGHPAGDKVLKYISHIVTKNIRKGDWAFRYGGEEFTLILPNADIDEAANLAERIREAMEKSEIKVSNDISLKQTVSLGVTGTEQIDEWKNAKGGDIKNILDQLVANADQALYVSKNSGRNQMNVFEEEKEKVA